MATAVLGMQWGDEGKGKISHLLARDATMVVRFNGGPNAGHTVIDQGKKFGTHQIPTGAFYPGVLSVLANGMVIDMAVLKDEYEAIAAHLGMPPSLCIAENAHLILPYHRMIEELEGSGKAIGTTRRGIGPAYRDKAARIGIRAGDLLAPERLRTRLATRIELLKRLWPTAPQVVTLDPVRIADELLHASAPFIGAIKDAAGEIRAALSRGEQVLFEGAQGALLDLDFGTYPYVTSSGTTFAGLPQEIGVPNPRVDRRIGVAKAYTTRVGAGPFPTEIKGALGQELQKKGGEFGVTTGRPRRCGWLDLVALRHAVAVNDPTELAITKLDVLSGLDKVKVCRAYRVDGEEMTRFPSSADELSRCVPAYEVLPGWKEDLRAIRTLDELPGAARDYLGFIADALSVPIGIISVGPEPEDSIFPL